MQLRKNVWSQKICRVAKYELWNLLYSFYIYFYYLRTCIIYGKSTLIRLIHQASLYVRKLFVEHMIWFYLPSNDKCPHLDIAHKKVIPEHLIHNPSVQFSTLPNWQICRQNLSKVLNWQICRQRFVNFQIGKFVG